MKRAGLHNLPRRQAIVPAGSSAAVLVATVLSFWAFYAPQPMLPMLSRELSVSATQIAWLMTIPFITLAIAPLLVGRVLQQQNARWLLAVGIAGLGVFELAVLLIDHYRALLIVRALQSLMLPIVFTSAMTWFSRVGDPATQADRVAVYVAATIVGGFFGRLASGVLGTVLSWKAPFGLLGALLLGTAIWIALRVPDAPADPLSSRRGQLSQLMSQPITRAGLMLIATTFFAFAATLNALPFRLVELQPGMPASTIALAYVGYVIGVFIALRRAWIVSVLGSEQRVLQLGWAALTVGLLGLIIPSTAALFGVGLMASAGIFLLHSTLSGLLSSRAGSNVSLMNGAYIAVYYLAAALGSVAPLWLYHQVGWWAFVGLMLGIGFLALLPLRQFGRLMSR